MDDEVRHTSPGGGADYQHPSLLCDLVMKGGITSGITYPKAVCEIARTYRIRNVGGTSAGAMAAAAAAAAEAGRSLPDAGFQRLEQLPSRLSADSPAADGSVMFNLFQPARRTRPLLLILSAALRGKGSRFRQARYIAWAILKVAPLAALVGAALGLASLVLAIVALATGGAGSGVAVAALWFGALAGLLLAVIGMFAAAAASLALRGLKALPENRFGICSGFAPGDPCPPGTPRAEDLQVGQNGRLMPKPLTTWLADELDHLAGKTDPKTPLTLQDLADAGVNLKMFTTNLTDGTPYTMPFRNRMFFFSPDEFRELFPGRIVDWMISPEVVPTARDDDELVTFGRMRHHNLWPLPNPPKMPVVVMARLSLSFPALMSAVPLWAMRLSDADEHYETVPKRCWCSDGGITSNFPIHFFDGPLPRWPTFGINLGPEEHLDQDDCKNIWSPLRNEAGISARWRQIEGMTGFGHAIIDTMQNWMDNAQTRVPGYRDRIVVIKHTKAEGGMNLNMDPTLIENFSERGRCAGEFLVNRLSHDPSTNPGDELSWSNHRWLRYRSLMPLLEQLVVGIVKGYEWPPEPADQRSYATLIAADLKDTPSYRWLSGSQRQRAIELTDRLLALVRDWGRLTEPIDTTLPPVDLSLTPSKDRWDESRPFAAGAPRPRPVLRIVRDF
jgi:predicted acylesterase/phospholipase RssA